MQFSVEELLIINQDEISKWLMTSQYKGKSILNMSSAQKQSEK